MKICWQHRGNIIFPTGVSKRGLSSSMLVDRALKMTCTASVRKLFSRSKSTEQIFTSQTEQNFQLGAQIILLLRVAEQFM